MLARPVKQVDENVATTRLFNLLARDTGRKDFRAAAEHGMRYLISLAEDDLVVPGALLADRELSREPAHVTIVGAKDDPAAQALYAAARTYPTRYLRIEWLDRREGPLPVADIEYPEMPEAAAFACANGACSVPVFTPGSRSRASSPRSTTGSALVVPTSEPSFPVILRVARRPTRRPSEHEGPQARRALTLPGSDAVTHQPAGAFLRAGLPRMTGRGSTA